MAMNKNNTFNERIGLCIRKQREYLGFTREVLSENIDISPEFLSEIERGVKGVSAMTLYKLCNGLSLSADAVLMGRETPSDVSPIVGALSCLNSSQVACAEEILRAFVKYATQDR